MSVQLPNYLNRIFKKNTEPLNDKGFSDNRVKNKTLVRLVKTNR